MKNFNGKAIYNPSGKAGEYSYWACNFYVGCSNGCTYCYLKNGVLAHEMGENKPTLKKCFKSTEHALEIFKKELLQNMPELQKYGLFFTFTSDPCLPDTIELTMEAVNICMYYHINIKILTKRADWVNDFLEEVENFEELSSKYWRKDYAFGFTLTGKDSLEPNASTNAERIEAMKKLHEAGFKTFASIEPIIDFERSLKMIDCTLAFCDLYKIGLESGRKYNKEGIHSFIYSIESKINNLSNAKIYFKDSLLKQAGINREDLPDNCVDRDYNIKI
jgi:DNA repair photolyase